jgi:DNA invertase Pin-like site-specific DNA recombinase
MRKKSSPRGEPSAADENGAVIAASYERVSTAVQGRYGYSLGAQALDSAEFATSNGWALPEHLRFRDGVDQNASGADWALPGLNAMLDAARRHEFTMLVVPDVDRFARNMAKALILEEELRRSGVRVVYIKAPYDDSPEGRLMKHQLFAIAEFDRDKRAFITTRTRREKASRGLYVGTGAPLYGYRYLREDTGLSERKARVIGLQVYEPEARVVRMLFEHAKHQSLAALLRWLDAAGHASPQRPNIRNTHSASGWTAGGLQHLLRNRTYAGLASWGGIDIPVPPIIDMDSFEAVQHAFAYRHRRPSGWISKLLPDGADPYILRGLVVCAPCTERTGRKAYLCTESMEKRGRRYYLCGNREESRLRRVNRLAEDRCPLPGLRAELVEEHVWTLVSGLVLDPERRAQGLELAREKREQDNREQGDRRQTVDAMLAKQRRTLHRLVLRLGELDPDDEGDRAEIEALSRARDDTKRLVSQLDVERATLDGASQPVGLSSAEAEELEALFAGLGPACASATAGERRQVVDALRLEVWAWPDSDGHAPDEALRVQVQHNPKRWARLDCRGVVRLDGYQPTRSSNSRALATAAGADRSGSNWSLLKYAYTPTPSDR